MITLLAEERKIYVPPGEIVKIRSEENIIIDGIEQIDTREDVVIAKRCDPKESGCKYCDIKDRNLCSVFSCCSECPPFYEDLFFKIIPL